MEALISEMLDGSILLAEAVSEFEKIYIKEALSRNNDQLVKTARALGIHRNTLSSKLAGYKESEKSTEAALRVRAVSKKKPAKKLKARAAGSSR
jgi:DNA-binding NtrC family response regulator